MCRMTARHSCTVAAADFFGLEVTALTFQPHLSWVTFFGELLFFIIYLGIL